MPSSLVPALLPSRLCALVCAALCGLALWSAPISAAAENQPVGGRRPLSFQLGNDWIGEGVSFSPYRDGQGPEAGMGRPTDAEIAADLELAVRYWKLIRMYDSTEVTERTLRIIRDRKLPMKVIVGAWIAKEDMEPGRKELNDTEVANAIRLANTYPDQVLAVNVGNEACVWWSHHRCGPELIIKYVRAVRAGIRQPVTTADDINFWELPESKALAAECDFLILHAYALWRGQQVDHAVDWLADNYDRMVKYHGGIPIVIGETGWASRHDPKRNKEGQEGVLMKGEVSDTAQLRYLRQHYRWVRARHVPTFLFEAFDENWKGGGLKVSPDAAEKHWGVFDAQRRPKPAFSAIIREYYEKAKN